MSTTTTLPAPSGVPVTRATAQYPHADALVRELRSLAADLGGERIDDRDPAVLARYQDTHATLRVGVYVPGGSRVSVHMGWYPRGPRWRAAADAVVAYLPGARLVEDSDWDVQWGSREPGWSPSAVWVWRGVAGLWREPDTVWDAAACARHCGIGAGTWRSYVTRGDAGAPKALGEARTPGVLRGTTVAVSSCSRGRSPTAGSRSPGRSPGRARGRRGARREARRIVIRHGCRPALVREASQGCVIYNACCRLEPSGRTTTRSRS